MRREKTAVLLFREDPREPLRPEEVMSSGGSPRLRATPSSPRYSSGGEGPEVSAREGEVSSRPPPYGPEKLIFNEPLSPGQIFNIGKEFELLAMDRFNLILEIFASRASTREAKLQVELARLSYEAPFVRTIESLKKLSERPATGLWKL